MALLECIFKAGSMDVAVVVIETRVESNRLFAEVAEGFSDRPDARAVRVLAGLGTRTELRSWG